MFYGLFVTVNDAPSLPAKAHNRQEIVAFDVDGTVTWTDSFFAFLRFWAGRRGTFGKLTRLLPSLARTATKSLHRDAMKARTVRMFFKGVDQGDYEAAARAFGREVLPRLVREDALRALKGHVAQGERVILVSASLEDYLHPLAEYLGAEGVLATRLERSGGRLTGRMVGANCRGVEKQARIEAAFGTNVRVITAYGDSAGDFEMLAMTDSPGYRVFTGQPRQKNLRLWQLYANRMPRQP